MVLTRKWVMKCFVWVILHSKAGQWGLFFITMFTLQTHVVLLIITKLATHANDLSGWVRQVKPVKSFCIESLRLQYQFIKRVDNNVYCRCTWFWFKCVWNVYIHNRIYTYRTTGCKIHSSFKKIQSFLLKVKSHFMCIYPFMK